DASGRCRGGRLRVRWSRRGRVRRGWWRHRQRRRVREKHPRDRGCCRYPCGAVLALHDEGYSATGVANGQEALQYLRRTAPPNLILLGSCNRPVTSFLAGQKALKGVISMSASSRT